MVFAKYQNVLQTMIVKGTESFVSEMVPAIHTVAKTRNVRIIINV